MGKISTDMKSSARLNDRSALVAVVFFLVLPFATTVRADPLLLHLLPPKSEIAGIGYAQPRPAVFRVQIGGFPGSATVVIYSVRQRDGLWANRVATIVSGKTGATVLSDQIIGGEGDRPLVLGEPSGAYDLHDEEGSPVIATLGGKRPGSFKLYAWRGNGFKLIFDRGYGGTGGQAMKTKNGRTAFVIRNDWHWGHDLPDVYIIGSRGVTLGYSEFPELFDPYIPHSALRAVALG